MRYLPSHPLAGSNGKVATARLILWEKLEGSTPSCHWCGDSLTWMTVCADHLDHDPTNNVPANVVPSCRGCNANREDGTGHGRRSLDPKPCAYCGTPFVARRENHKRQRTCSISCARRLRGPFGSRMEHGTMGRYKYGCRCPACRGACAEVSRQRRRAQSKLS